LIRTRVLRDASRFVLPWTLVLALCGDGLAEAGNAVSGQAAAGQPKPHEMLYAFATSRLNISETVRINSHNGAFISVSTGSVPFFANSSAVASNAQFLYISNSFINGGANSGSEIFGYSIQPGNGTLTPLVGSPFFYFPPPISIQGLATTPDGHFLYGADDSGHIFAFALDRASGIPTSVPGSPFNSGANSQLVVDPSGKFLYASNDNQLGSVAAYTISATGALTPIQGSPFAIPVPSFNPTSTEPYGIVDTGSFVYVTLSATNNIAAFSIDGATGALAPVSGSPFAAGNSPAAFALSGNFLYAVNPGDGTVSAYRIDSGNGTLTPLPGSPFGSGGETLAIDASENTYISAPFGGFRATTSIRSLARSLWDPPDLAKMEFSG
jgi:DNA-binding beta-propeller fold protein YncE